MTTFDVHQHLWPEQLIAELARRQMPPRLHGSRLELPLQGSFEVDLDAHGLDTRLRDLDRDGIDVAVISLAPTLEIEDLPGEEAQPLLDAYHDGILELVAAAGGRLRALAAGCALDGFVGASIPAAALGDADALAPLLDEVGRRRGVLFVHPGPAAAPAWAPGWWVPVVDYTTQMQAAHAAWLAAGVDRWPRLPVVFALLAGGAPFQFERLATRGVPVRTVLRPSVYFETSSYGRRAIELCLATFGVRQVVYGSDLPVIETGQTLRDIRGFGQAVADALCRDNPALLFT